jgi:Protein of unknown function (DUF4058)
MPSPFPGMDPYIESWIWPDFHAAMISALRDQLNPLLPKRFIASSDLYVWREELSEEERRVLGGPDVQVVGKGPSSSGAALATIPAPFTTLMRGGLERKQRYLRVIDHKERRIVTVIEILSPSNKTAHRTGEAYRFKREEYFTSGINLVEIDLLRMGIRPPLGDPPPPVNDYYVMVFRHWQQSQLSVWPFSMRDPLPPVPVPLDPDDREVVLNLRACLDRAYDFGRYPEQLDYTQPLKPPLREPDATWAHELLTRHANLPTSTSGEQP